MSTYFNKELVERVQEALAKKEPVYFSAQGVSVTFQTRVVAVQEKVIKIRNAVAPAYIPTVVQSKQFCLQLGTTKLYSNHIDSDGENIVFSPETVELNPDFRKEERVIAGSTFEEPYCDILNPFDGVTVLRRKIIEMSPSGLSIRNNYESKLFQEGVFFDQLKIWFNQGQQIKQGSVIYSRPLMNLQSELFFQTGIRFEKPA